MSNEVEVEDPETLEAQAPPSLPPEVVQRRAAALAHVRQWGDPVLRTKASRIDRFDDDLRLQVAHMGRLMDDALGIGLAAPQVGISHRLLVYRTVSGGPLNVLVNPQLDWSSKDEELLEEGCLSLPAVHVEVERPVHVRVAAQDEYGEAQLVEASGLEARVIQHEMDHLDGTLILDRISRGARKEAMRALREAQVADASS